MVRARRKGVLIAGGGLAGCLAALALARRRPDLPALLVEEAEAFGTGRCWTFFEDELGPEEAELVAPLIAARWPGYYAAFPGQTRNLKAPCAAITGASLDAGIRAALGEDRIRTARAVAVREDELVLLGGEQVRAEAAVDARGAANMSMLELGWRRVAARDYRLAAPHGLDRPVLIDATVGQGDGLRFMRCLPLDGTLMRIEDVSIGDTPDQDQPAAGERLDAYAALRGWAVEAVEGEEVRELPMPLGGDVGAFLRFGGARVARLGLRGFYLHPTGTGTVADAARNALMLAGQRDFAGAALHDAFEADAVAAWRRREPYRAFNRSLLQGPPEERLGALADLYAQEPGTIARFWAEKLGMIERMKLARARR